MNLLNRVIPNYNYNYNYFDSLNQFQEKQLNIFQYILRRVFGCYAETHLSNVVKKGYTLTLNNQFPAKPEKQQNLLKLIKKAYDISKLRDIELGDYRLSSSKNVKISLFYDIKKPKKEAEDFKISSIDFKLTFTENSLLKTTDHLISIFKNNSNELVTCLPKDLFERYSTHSEDSLKLCLNSEEAKITNDLIAKTLHDSNNSRDSSVSPELAEVRYYAEDYDFMQFDTSPLIRPILNPTYRKAMNDKLGWKYLGRFIKPGAVTPMANRKTMYVLKKESAENNHNLVNLGFTQTISLAFAASVLETQERDY